MYKIKGLLYGKIFFKSQIQRMNITKLAEIESDFTPLYHCLR